jgi:hypothetical protein
MPLQIVDDLFIEIEAGQEDFHGDKDSRTAARTQRRKGSALHDSDWDDLGHEASYPQFVGDADDLVDVLISGAGFLGDTLPTILRTSFLRITMQDAFSSRFSP